MVYLRLKSLRNLFQLLIGEFFCAGLDDIPFDQFLFYRFSILTECLLVCIQYGLKPSSSPTEAVLLGSESHSHIQDAVLMYVGRPECFKGLIVLLGNIHLDTIPLVGPNESQYRIVGLKFDLLHKLFIRIHLAFDALDTRGEFVRFYRQFFGKVQSFKFNHLWIETKEKNASVLVVFFDFGNRISAVDQISGKIEILSYVVLWRWWCVGIHESSGKK